MSKSEYSQFLFEKHDRNKFQQYEEIQNHKGFRLPNDNINIIYLLDEEGGWCDLNGCYYNSECQPDGWIILSKDGKQYMKFDMNSDLIKEKPNIYYSNKSFDAANSEQYFNQIRKDDQQRQQLLQNQKQQSQKESKKQQNQPNKEFKKKYENKEGKQEAKQKEKNKETDKWVQKNEKNQDEDQNEDQYIDKIDKQILVKNNSQEVEKNEKQEEFLNKRDKRQKNRKYNNRKSQNQDQDQSNNQKKKYYILNINENNMSQDQFLKCLIEGYKIKENDIIEFNENILKLSQEKDAIKLYRQNKQEQSDQNQQFIVSI